MTTTWKDGRVSHGDGGKPRTLKFGKLAPKKHPKTLLLKNYMLPGLPPPPEKVFREYKVPDDQWGMYANDQIGCCTCAAKAHIVMMMTAHTGKMFAPDVKDVVAMYSAISGYDPVTGANDNGCAMTDVLNYMQTKGLSGHTILGWAQIDQTNLTMLRQGVYIFGTVDTGFQVPQSAMDQFNAGRAWDVVPNDGGIQGGHDVPYFGYGSAGDDCVTWAKNQKLTNAFVAKYVDEAYVMITKDWLNEASGLAPNTLNLDQLTKDLAALKA